VNPSQKILALEEDAIGINDGMWCAGGADLLSFVDTLVSVRHDRGREVVAPSAGIEAHYTAAGRGNILFADGHCDFWHRREFHLGSYYNPRRRD